VQKFWSILFGATMFAALLLFIISPFVSGWWLPKDISTFGDGIDRLFYLILAITGFFFVLTEAILVYAMYRYASRPGQKASYFHGNHKLEVIWTLVPAVILLLLAVFQINVWAEVKFQKNMPAPDAKTQQLEVTARQWEWRVRYPSVQRMQSWKTKLKDAQDFATSTQADDVHIPNELHVWKGGKEPKDQHRVLVHLKTRDVLHSFFLPNLRLKQDALPGKVIPVWFKPIESNVTQVKDKEGKVVAWVGDGNNVAHSWLDAAGVLGFELRLACPAGYRPHPDIVARNRALTQVLLTDDPAEAVRGAHVVNTDVWASMGQEAEQAERERAFAGYIVDGALMRLAASGAIFLHCLPAHRGEEVSDEVIEGPQSRVWDEAENRLHAQKALMATLLSS